MKTLSKATLFAMSVSFLSFAPAAADSVADFYRGKTVNFLIGYGAGGEYDLHARLVAKHISEHIPGSPTIIAQNMTGAGGARMAAYLADVTEKDGTNVGMIPNNFPAMQAAGFEVIRFDIGKFQWIGSIAPTVETMAVWKTADVDSIDGARTKEVVAGATGKGAITYTFPAMLNEFAGTKFKIVTGYQGGNAINLAMERGEVQARNNTWSSWKVTRPEWLKSGSIRVIAYAGPKPSDLDGVPSVSELAQSEDGRKIVEFITAGTRLGRPLAFAGGVPKERVDAFRKAFDATMKDPEFIAEAKKLNIESEPVAGEELQKIVADVLATPERLTARARKIME